MSHYSFWLIHRRARIAFLVGSPVILLVFLACAGIRTLSVFKLKVGRVEYKIGAQKYTSNTNDDLDGLRFAYPAASSWPEPIRDISLWLLFHLILGILVAIYLVLLSASLFFRRPYPTQAIVNPRWWSYGSAVVLASLVIALASRDAVFWGQGDKYGFRPDILGYFVIIGSLLVGTAWLWALASIKFGDAEYVGSRRGKDIAHYEPRRSHKRSHSRGYDRGEGRSRKRSKKNVNWWERMTKA